MSEIFKDIIRSWLLHYDDRLPSDRKERRKAFIVLIGTLKEYGYGKEELDSSRKEKIIRFCVNPNYKNKSKLKKWTSVLVNDLEAAIIICYPTIKIKEDFLTDEMCSKLEEMERKAEASKLLRKPEEEEDSDQEFSIEDNTPLDIGNDIKKADHSKQEEFEITDEMLEGVDEPEIAYDPDFMKKLGIE